MLLLKEEGIHSLGGLHIWQTVPFLILLTLCWVGYQLFRRTVGLIYQIIISYTTFLPHPDSQFNFVIYRMFYINYIYFKNDVLQSIDTYFLTFISETQETTHIKLHQLLLTIIYLFPLYLIMKTIYLNFYRYFPVMFFSCRINPTGWIFTLISHI